MSLEEAVRVQAVLQHIHTLIIAKPLTTHHIQHKITHINDTTIHNTNTLLHAQEIKTRLDSIYKHITKLVTTYNNIAKQAIQDDYIKENMETLVELKQHILWLQDSYQDLIRKLARINCHDVY
jgi:hypothetical protein